MSAFLDEEVSVAATAAAGVRICAVTNVYNESFNLPIWLSYYGRQVGLENCFVIDDGTDDGSTSDLGVVNRLRLPSTKFDDGARSRFISTTVSSLVGYYDWVLYTDCDEILVADPRRHRSLAELCAHSDMPAITAIGLNVVHNLAHEAPIRSGEPIIGRQRRYVQFASSMCKTLLVREPVSWGGGFHSSNFQPSFGELYLFHLRHLDLGESLRRLAMTRNIDNADGSSAHHRESFVDQVRRFQHVAQMPVGEGPISFEDDRAEWESRLAFSHTNRYYVERQFGSKELRRVPDYFDGAF